MTDQMIIRREGAAGYLTLNRPKAIHALTQPMDHAMTEALLEWRDDPAVEVVSPTNSTIKTKPIATPSIWGMVRRKPKLAPEAISIRLFGPGVTEETKAKSASAAKRS